MSDNVSAPVCEHCKRVIPSSMQCYCVDPFARIWDNYPDIELRVRRVKNGLLQSFLCYKKHVVAVANNKKLPLAVLESFRRLQGIVQLAKDKKEVQGAIP